MSPIPQVAMNPVNTVFDAKRLIGRKAGDASVQADVKHWPFTVKSGPADKPVIEGEPAASSGQQPSACVIATVSDTSG